MTKSLSCLLLLLSWGTGSHASLETYLQQQSAGRTANTMDYGGICGSVGKVYQGYSWSEGGGKTTFQVTCSGVQVEISCEGKPTFSKCQSTSAAGQTGLGSGCICKAAHPTCKSNGWCYKGHRWSSSNCPGSCTASATAPAPPSPPAPPPPPPPAPAGCTCPASYPFCYNGNNWCYKSPSSSDYTHKCGGECTADYPSSAPSPTPTSGAAGAQAATTGNCGGQEQLSQSQAQEMLDLHNQFRACVGTPPLQWNAALQCQAQKTQDDIGAFKHSSSYSKPISAGENLASGTSVSMAAWMWFTEYTQQGDSGKPTGHYTAMVWKDTTHLGCGIQHGGKGVIRCQYAATAPNYQGQYSTNVPAFYGEASKFAACGISIATVKEKVQKFQGWGILHPNHVYSSSLGLFDASGPEVAWTNPLSKTSASVVAAAGVLFVVLGVVGIRRRVLRDQSTDTDAELLMVESAE